jgi:hypothetical protein
MLVNFNAVVCPARSVAVKGWFWLLLLGTLLAACAAYVALVLNQATYADVLAQGHLLFFDGEYACLPVRVSASEFARAQWVAFSAAAGLVLVLVRTCATWAGGQEVRALRAETSAALAGALRGLARLTLRERWLSGLSLGLLTSARCYLSVVKSYQADEVASYDFFVRPGLLAVSSFYPIPNNHVLANTLSWVFLQMNPNVWFTLRLPVVLTSTVGTVALFAGLLRVSSFRVALLALTLFGWVQPSLYYAVAGRGYWLLMTLAGGHFLAVMVLLARPGLGRIAWATLLVTGVLGCYTVPTFVYVVASATSYLAGVALLRRDWAGLGQVTTGVLGMGASVGLLYTPLLLLSGWRLLLVNGYVAPRPWLTVVRALPGFAWLTEGVLLGHDTVGAWGFVLGMAAVGGLLWRQRLRPAQFATRRLVATTRRLVWPALWFVLFPYLLVLGQRVLPPARTLLYKELFFFILVGILLDAGLRMRPTGRWGQRLVSLSLLLFVAYQTYTMSVLVAASRRVAANSLGVFEWLVVRPPGPVLVQENETALYLLFLAHYRTPHRHWQLATRARPGERYRYIIVPHGYKGPSRSAPLVRLAYHNEEVDLYELLASGQLARH